jgi:putative transposase
MRLIDQGYTEQPFYGSRKVVRWLLDEHKRAVNRKRVQRLMRLMRLEVIYPRPKLTVRDNQHKVYPYLLRNVVINRPNQVWSTDITYIRLKGGFLYLTAVISWKVLLRRTGV